MHRAFQQATTRGQGATMPVQNFVLAISEEANTWAHAETHCRKRRQAQGSRERGEAAHDEGHGDHGAGGATDEGRLVGEREHFDGEGLRRDGARRLGCPAERRTAPSGARARVVCLTHGNVRHERQRACAQALADCGRRSVRSSRCSACVVGAQPQCGRITSIPPPPYTPLSSVYPSAPNFPDRRAPHYRRPSQQLRPQDYQPATIRSSKSMLCHHSSCLRVLTWLRGTRKHRHTGRQELHRKCGVRF